MPHLNRIRDLWDQKTAVVNGWLAFGSPIAAETYAVGGYDSVTVDMQHGFVGIDQLVPNLIAIRAAGAIPMVRPPALEASVISQALDAGALGIICPLIDTAEEAAELVNLVRYPPLGKRSSGPTRAGLIYPDYYNVANKEVAIFAMIETRMGVDNLSQIVRTPGLDGVYIGPSDLALGLEDGRLAPGIDRTEPGMIAAIRQIAGAAHEAGIKAGIHTGSAEYAARAVNEWGFEFVTLLNDVRTLAAASAESVRQTRSLIRRS